MRSTIGLTLAIVLLAAPGAAQGHAISKRDMKRAAGSHVAAIARGIPALAPTAVAKVTAVRSSCRRGSVSRGHRHAATCRVSVDIRDWEGATHVATRTCTDGSVRLAVLRTGRVAVVARTVRLTCRLSGAQPTLPLESPSPPQSEPVPAPAEPTPGTAEPTPGTAEPTPDAPAAPASDTLPPPPGLPPGAPPPGPPPGVTPTAQAAGASGDRRFFSAARTALAAQAWPRPGFGFHSCSWQQLSGWWIYNCYWIVGSSAPPGAHLIGWKSVWYYERWYWGYDSAGNLGVLPWYWGYHEY